MVWAQMVNVWYLPQAMRRCALFLQQNSFVQRRRESKCWRKKVSWSIFKNFNNKSKSAIIFGSQQLQFTAATTTSTQADRETTTTKSTNEECAFREGGNGVACPSSWTQLSTGCYRWEKLLKKSIIFSLSWWEMLLLEISYPPDFATKNDQIRKT